MKIFLLRASVFTLALMPGLAAACEGCKSSSIDEGGTPNAIGVGFGASVYFFIGMLLLVSSVLGWQMMKQFARSKPAGSSRRPRATWCRCPPRRCCATGNLRLLRPGGDVERGSVLRSGTCRLKLLSGCPPPTDPEAARPLARAEPRSPP